MKVLIFPCNTIEAIVKAQELILAGMEVIGASSVKCEYQIADNIYSDYLELPHITNESFDKKLSQLLEEQQVDFIWSSIGTVNKKLTQNLNERASTTKILSAPSVPFNLLLINTVKVEVKLRSRYLEILGEITELPRGTSEHFISNILAASLKVPGESHFDKLFTLCCIFNNVPDNSDIVEIGSLWGRTAKLFCCLSAFYKKGNLLCIDPWSQGEKVTQATHKLLDDMSLTYSGEDNFQLFVSNLSAEHYSAVNYIRDFSSNAAIGYFKNGKKVITPEFGQTSYYQKIGLLHIDGNHKHENVIEDIENYIPQVVAGGWIIFDDYNWAYGDGVTRAADEYVDASKNDIELCFFSGGALFIKLVGKKNKEST